MAVALTLMNEVDWFIILAIIILLMYGITQGLGKVLTTLMLWGVAFIVAQLVSRILSIPLAAYIGDPELLVMVPFSISFLFSLMILNLFFSFLSISTAKNPLMRFLGGFMAFPLALVQLLVIISFARLLTLDESDYWVESQLIPIILQAEFYWETYVMNGVCRLLPAAQCYPY